MKKITHNTHAIWLCLALLLSSCEREFDNNDDFNNNEQIEVFGDNDLLFNKIFQFTSGNAYLWFDIRNEIANFSSPFLGLSYNQNEIDYYRRIDLRGRLYRYDNDLDELTILAYPLDLAPVRIFRLILFFNLEENKRKDAKLLQTLASVNGVNGLLY